MSSLHKNSHSISHFLSKSIKSCCPQVLIPLVGDGSMEVEQNVELPDYLPEDESPSQEPDKAVSRVGSGHDGSSWLGAATNFLSRSFYWWPCLPPPPPSNLPPPLRTKIYQLPNLTAVRLSWRHKNWDTSSSRERKNRTCSIFNDAMEKRSCSRREDAILPEHKQQDHGFSLKFLWEDVVSVNGSICSKPNCLNGQEASRSNTNKYQRVRTKRTEQDVPLFLWPSYLFDFFSCSLTCFKGRATVGCAFSSSDPPTEVATNFCFYYWPLFQ